ncbi:MAG: hypothetical protein AB7G68_08420 [Nitrospiraceae bacterium]
MSRVYVLGAGSSQFAGFPLGSTLLAFLKSEWGKTRESVDKREGGYCLDFIDMIIPYLPEARRLCGEPDLEFVLSLIDLNSHNSCDEKKCDSLIQDLNAITMKIDLSAWDLERVKRGFAKLVTSAFIFKSYDVKSYQSSNPDQLEAAKDFTITPDAWTELINPGDTLITFNWDLLQEIFLSKAKKWRYEDGYGMEGSAAAGSLTCSPTTILKLHGSCNWLLRDSWDSFQGVDYADVFFDQLDADPKNKMPHGSTSDYGTSLIIPSYLKDPYKVAVLPSLWSRAGEKLRKATHLTVIGYSLPDADSFAKSLFQKTIGTNTSLISIEIIVNGDEKAFRRWQAICPNIQIDCKVPQTFKEYVTRNKVDN